PALPRALADVLVGHVVLDGRLLLGLRILRPHALWPAEVRDAWFVRDAGAAQDHDAAGRIDPALHPLDGGLLGTLAHRRDTLHSLRGCASRSPARRPAAARGILAEAGRGRGTDRDRDDAGHGDAGRPGRRAHGDLPRLRRARRLARLLYGPRE